jgi:hypothetical protein
MSAWLPSEVREAITTRIAALPVRAAYAGDATAWVRASYPLAPELEPHHVAPLRFFVDDRTTSQAGTPQLYDADCPGVTVRTSMVVRWLMPIRPGSDGDTDTDTDAVSDWDAAGDAAAHLVGWLLAPWHDYDRVALAGTFLERTPLDSSWIRCDLSILVDYTLRIG